MSGVRRTRRWRWMSGGERVVEDGLDDENFFSFRNEFAHFLIFCTFNCQKRSRYVLFSFSFPVYPFSGMTMISGRSTGGGEGLVGARTLLFYQRKKNFSSFFVFFFKKIPNILQSHQISPLGHQPHACPSLGGFKTPPQNQAVHSDKLGGVVPKLRAKRKFFCS